MKRYPLILTSIFVLLVFGISIASARYIPLPPSDPTQESPGPFVSEEQASKHELAAQAAKRCEENYKAALDYCVSQGYHHYGFVDRSSRCAKDALEAYHECLKGVHYFLNPPQLILPNGGSPGQPAQEPAVCEIPEYERIAMDEIQRYLDEVFRPCMERAVTPSERERCLEAWRVFQEGIRHYLQENRGFGPKCPEPDNPPENESGREDGGFFQ